MGGGCSPFPRQELKSGQRKHRLSTLCSSDPCWLVWFSNTGVKGRGVHETKGQVSVLSPESPKLTEKKSILPTYVERWHPSFALHRTKEKFNLNSLKRRFKELLYIALRAGTVVSACTQNIYSSI